jgi:hypothetical protein
MPDTTWPISRHPPGSIPGWAGRPVSMSSIAVFDTSSVDRSRSPSWPTPDALTARLSPRTLTTTALDRSSSGWFAASPCRATAEDHRPQGPAPPSPMQHRISQSDLLHRPPLCARGTPCRLRSPRKPLTRDRRRYPRRRTSPTGSEGILIPVQQLRDATPGQPRYLFVHRFIKRTGIDVLLAASVALVGGALVGR